MRCGKGEDYEGKYVGEFLYDLYHGEGGLDYSYNRGEFKNGQKTGLWGNNNYKNGKKNGICIDWIYTEEYVDDYLHGEKSNNKIKEMYYFGEKSNILNTEIKNNCIYFNGIKEYEGELSEDNKKNGKGTEFYKNGIKRYEVNFKNILVKELNILKMVILNIKEHMMRMVNIPDLEQNMKKIIKIK